MKAHFSMKKVFTAVLAALLLTCAVAAAVSSIPERAATKSGTSVQKNSKAAVDISNLDQGYLSVKYTGGKKVRIKVQIVKKDAGSVTYTYDLNNEGREEVFPLTEGDGTYTVKVFENTKGTKYAQAFTCTAKLKLESEFSPYLYANQYVNFKDDSQAVLTAAELVKNAGNKTDLEKVSTIYNYVVSNLSYDYELAKTVKSGYLPNVDKVLESKKGICFDYAALMAAMLRSQGIPCKLVIGYAGSVYHAWINVYIESEGWVDKLIYFDGQDWSLMDPTYISSSKNSESVREYVKNDTNYTQKYAY